MVVVPAIDLVKGRSRVVFWPGAASGVGAPTDHPERIAAAYVSQGARLIHLVDVDGARAGRPVSLAAIGAVASTVAVPLQVAGGLEDPDSIREVFAAGATRVVLSAAIADRPEDLAACLEVAGDWLAVGLDPRPERLAAFPWRRPEPPTIEGLIDELLTAGVGRIIVSHIDDTTVLAAIVTRAQKGAAEVMVAGGIGDLDGVRRLRAGGVAGVIIGEALMSGAIDLPAAIAEAA